MTNRERGRLKREIRDAMRPPFPLPNLPHPEGPTMTTAAAPFATLRLERNGDWIVTASGDRSRKCGPPAENHMAYRVFVECPDDALDADGFVIDHNEIQAYFERTFGHVVDFPSCERIAVKAIRDLHELMVSRGSRPCGIEVTVAAFGAAGITAHWPARTRTGDQRPLPVAEA